MSCLAHLYLKMWTCPWLRLVNNINENRRSSKIKKIFYLTGRSKFVKKVMIPFLLGLKFKTAVLVPLALALIALKTWKAMTLGLLSLVLTGAMLIFKFTKPKVDYNRTAWIFGNIEIYLLYLDCELRSGPLSTPPWRAPRRTRRSCWLGSRWLWKRTYRRPTRLQCLPTLNTDLTDLLFMNVLFKYLLQINSSKSLRFLYAKLSYPSKY